MKNAIQDIFKQSISIKHQIQSDPVAIELIQSAGKKCIAAYQNQKKVLWCGNGGSAADAQHLAAELSGRFYLNRPPLNSEALHVNASYITAVANDFSFEEIYARKLEAMGHAGDILIVLSTSGNSGNIIRAIQKAKELELYTIGMTGQDGGTMKGLCDLLIQIPSQDTPRIQECHMLIGHILCQIIESELFGKKSESK